MAAHDDASLLGVNEDRLIEEDDIIKLLPIEDASDIAAHARMVRLEPGLYALDVAAAIDGGDEGGEITLPAVHVSTPPSQRDSRAEIFGSGSKDTCWLGVENGTVIIRAPDTGGYVLITTYEDAHRPSSPREIVVRRIESRAPAPVRSQVLAAPPQNIAIEVHLHIEGVGDLRIPAEGWIGSLGRKVRLEAFGIRPLEALSASDIEYKAYGPNGLETPWISDGKLCGTRGRSLALTGFAVRLVAHQSHRFGVEYQGAFFESGIGGPVRDGRPCIARIADDPLEAITLRIFRRHDP
ncbi:MAG: hypothetical protein JO081_19915 [Alphaproteobacteria bacterium]|nr:hypothetical protein [Alphaproteobacteria bacterium]